MSNMLTPIIFEGRPTTDPELNTNQQTGSKYVRLTVMQNKGFSKESEHALAFTCFFNGVQAERLINAKVKHGNLLTIVGDFDSKEFMRTSKDNPNEQIHDRSLEVNVSNWSYTQQNKPKEGTPNQSASGTAHGQAAQGTPPAQNYPRVQNAALPQQNSQQYEMPPQNYQAPPQNHQQPPASGYQQQAAYPPPSGAAYNQSAANGFSNVPQEPLPFNN